MFNSNHDSFLWSGNIWCKICSRLGGLVVAQLDRSSFLEKQGADYKHHPLPLEGELSLTCINCLLCVTSIGFEKSMKSPRPLFIYLKEQYLQPSLFLQAMNKTEKS